MLKRFFTYALLGIALILAAAGGWLYYQIKNPPSLTPYAYLWIPPALASDRQAQLRVTFLGVSTLLLDDGETAILTDGFFSRPDAKAVFTGKITPDPEIIQRSLQHAGIKQLAAVIVAHSHYDHAMDAPEVARRTNAVLVGSESTANVGRGWGIKEQMIKVVHDAESLNFGRFQLKFIRSQHAPTGFTGGTIDAPLVPPVRAKHIKKDKVFLF
ncbi:MBL fold metallo-hydrolase [Undibacterium sp. Xuan67W]|uniref:MBL fold metallo-hydrolase n=1 Tax=Undibacterium sp. Xuan67W TaxID=3413057 RepID=UPI003BF1A87A